MTYEIARAKAIQQYDAAFHLLKVTYPLIQDPKLLMGIVTNISNSYQAAVEAILAYERQLQLVPAYGTRFIEKWNTFRAKSATRNKVDNVHLDNVERLQEMLQKHKESPVDFSKKGRFVLTGQDYAIQTVGEKELQEFLNHNKAFLAKMDAIVRHR
ncbi:TPA: hypothetical protein HA278_03050 [Candidatus Woesearchaeota archaeon]|nr:hypothetical protein [archaeon]HIJ11012.1 hypothetical protein [Candidatus Woesearchaeota archaeon]|tara:strand:+ start:274 stop:741 length:468 start_codon:yes stop_codon:yes gene_type:complete